MEGPQRLPEFASTLLLHVLLQTALAVRLYIPEDQHNTHHPQFDSVLLGRSKYKFSTDRHS